MKPDFRRYLSRDALAIPGATVTLSLGLGVMLLFFFGRSFSMTGVVFLGVFAIGVAALIFQTIRAGTGGARQGWRFWPAACGMEVLGAPAVILADTIRLLPMGLTPLLAALVPAVPSYGPARRASEAGACEAGRAVSAPMAAARAFPAGAAGSGR